MATSDAAKATMGNEATLAWVPSSTIDGEWLQARVINQHDSAEVELKVLETGEKHVTTSDVSNPVSLHAIHL